MKSFARIVSPFIALCMLTLSAPSLAGPVPDPIQFYTPQFVVQPKTLLGDAGDSRCPASTEKCFKNVDDMLYGQTHLMREDDIVFAYPGGYALFNTSESTISGPGNNHFVLGDGSTRYTAPAVVGARIFNTASDVSVTVVLDRNASVLSWRLDGQLNVAQGNLGLTQSGSVAMAGLQNGNAAYLSVIAGDFTGDGYDEIVVFPKGPFAATNAIVASAVDTSDPTKGLRFGQPFDLTNHDLPFSTTLASVQKQPRVFVAGPTANNGGCSSGYSGLHFESYTINSDPTSSQFLNLTSEGMFGATLPEGNNPCLHSVNMTAGRFSTPLHDQLLVTYAVDGGNVKVLPIDLNDQAQAVPMPVFDSGVIIGGGFSAIRAGRLIWNSPLDLAVLFISNNLGDPNLNSLRILSFDQNFNPTVKSTKQGTGAPNECAAEVMVGNFDHHNAAPNPPPVPPPSKDSLFNPNLQIATLTNDCGNISALRIWDIDPDNFAIMQHGVDFNYVPGSSVFRSAMATVDLQGRSYRVGPPAIVTVEHTQPSLIMSAVPMHTDAVVPVGSNNPALGITNISGMPGAGTTPGLQTTFTFASSLNTSTTSTFTNSATFSGQEKVEGHEALGDCDEGPCESVSLHASFTQKIASSDSSTNGSFNTTTQSLTSATGFQDSVTYESNTLTTYVYPVLGRSVCPSGTTGCADSEKIPLRASVAGPDTVRQVLNAAGDTLTWYQPPWIPGNILSYPGNINQLKLATNGIEDFQDYAGSSQITLSPSGTLSTETTWTGGGNNGSSSGVNRDFSYEAGISVVYQVTFADVLRLGGSADLDFGESTSFSGLTEVNRTVDATQGIGFAQSANLASSDYVYSLTPHIFGKKQPLSTVSDNTTPTDVRVFGALRTAYEVDVSSGFGGSYWGAWYGKAPDLALSQPDHWVVNLEVSDPRDGTCLPFNASSSDVDCVSLGPRLPQGLGEPIWLSNFHMMRGFFISNSASGQGPQVTTATTGDQLTLTARVYNLSLAADDQTRNGAWFPEGTLVHVRFMGMPWDSSSNTQAGDSFLIGDATPPLSGDQLPPHNSDTGNPNWALASAKFDTSGTNCGGKSCDGMNLLFWVVVWADQQSPPPNQGNMLVTELPQHGLSTIPAAGEDFLQVAQREQAYSNNLGLYNQVFHIFPKNPPLRAPTPVAGEIGAQITGVGSSLRELNRGQYVALSAKVKTGGRDIKGGLAVDFYDGNPDASAKLAGLQRHPFLNANSQYDYRVLFRPHACGVHTIYAVAGNGTRHEHVARFRPIEVKCPNTAKLAAGVTGKTGAQNARKWTLSVSNTGTATAGNTQIDALKLTQTSGATCTPTVSNPSSFPLEIGNIPVGSSVNAFVTIDFTGCAPAARFRADLAFSSNHGIVPGTASLNNQFR